MIRLTTAVAAVLAAIVLSSTASARPAAIPVLKGTVGPGFTISLKKNGAKVTKLKAGLYKFVIADKSSIHDFVIEKQAAHGLERQLTTVSFVGTKSKLAPIRLTKGKWKFYCKPHESSMFGFFTVT